MPGTSFSIAARARSPTRPLSKLPCGLFPAAWTTASFSAPPRWCWWPRGGGSASSDRGRGSRDELPRDVRGRGGAVTGGRGRVRRVGNGGHRRARPIHRRPVRRLDPPAPLWIAGGVSPPRRGRLGAGGVLLG